MEFTEERLAINLTLNSQESMHISIYNMRGQQQANLHSGILEAGAHDFYWMPQSNLTAGTYFISLSGLNGKKGLRFVVD